MPPRLRTLLVLGRVSNLPTVWSNCIAGWWLAGGGNSSKLPLLLLGVSALYIGGMYLNDAFDEDWDRLRRAERPIPSGKISAKEVWRFGWAWLAAGSVLLIILGRPTGALALVLALCIVIYDATHKLIGASPWLMGACRFWIYVIAGTTGAKGLNGWPLWCGAALAVYIAGVSYLARGESLRGKVPFWPLALLLAPVLLAWLMNVEEFRRWALWFSLVPVLWTAFCAWELFLAGVVNLGRVVSGLLAGIVFVDWLAVAPQIPHAAGIFIFLGLFALTKALQKFVPAT